MLRYALIRKAVALKLLRAPRLHQEIKRNFVAVKAVKRT